MTDKTLIELKKELNKYHRDKSSLERYWYDSQT